MVVLKIRFDIKYSSYILHLVYVGLLLSCLTAKPVFLFIGPVLFETCDKSIFLLYNWAAKLSPSCQQLSPSGNKFSLLGDKDRQIFKSCMCEHACQDVSTESIQNTNRHHIDYDTIAQFTHSFLYVLSYMDQIKPIKVSDCGQNLSIA